MIHRYDAVIIGTGQAGPSLAGRLAAAGMKVAIVERHRFGGTCVNCGGILTYGLFIDPPLGRAGMTEAQVRASGRKALIARRPTSQVGRARDRVVGDALAAELVHAFLGASFTGEDRYRRRLDKIRALEDHALGGSREGGEGTP